MKKSSLGRRSSAAAVAKKTSDFMDRNKSGIPILARSIGGGGSCRVAPGSVHRKRELSSDRISMPRKRRHSGDRMSEVAGLLATPKCSGTTRTPRLMTSSLGRPSSILSRKGDDRPLTDKAWQKIAMNTVQRALTVDLDGCNILQNYKSLKPMSINLFVDITNFFVNKLDPRLELTKANYITELPFILKKLRYQGKTDKSMFLTVNTLLTWPYVLGILHFLAEYVQAMEDFSAEGLNSIYPTSIEKDPDDEELLNFKFLIPLLHQMWDSVGKKEEPDIKMLLNANQMAVNDVMVKSGFTSDVLEKANIAKKEHEEQLKKHEEISDLYDKVDQQYKDALEKLSNSKKKNEMYSSELEELTAQLEEATKKTKQLEQEIKYVEEECVLTQRILNDYAPDESAMTQKDYASYKIDKEIVAKNIQHDIKYEEIALMTLNEMLFSEAMAEASLKIDIENYFKEYNSKIAEIMADDMSVRSALCLTIPRIGVTPCNSFTAQLLENTIKSYEERISQAEADLKKKPEDSTEEFQFDEDMKDKMAHLVRLRTVYTDISSQHEKKKNDLQNELMKAEKECLQMNDDILSTEQELKKNHQNFEEKEKEFKLKEEQVREYFAASKKKLEQEYNETAKMGRNLKAMEDELKEETRRILITLKSMLGSSST